MQEELGIARRFVAHAYPLAEAAFLGGSAATGRSTSTSDLDVLILLPAELDEVACVETLEFEGRLIEAFVYGPTAWLRWTAKGRAGRRPVLDSLAAYGLTLTANERAHAVQQESRAALEAGPAPLDEGEMDARRYSLTALVDDLGGNVDLAEGRVIAATAWAEAAELALLLQGSWLGTGKWLVRQLVVAGGHPLVDWLEEGASHEALAGICLDVLDLAGGPLQAGMLRGDKSGRRASDPVPRYAVVPASYVFLRRDGRVLLQERQNTGYMDGHWVAGAAGHVEHGETARQAAVREAAEELGIVIHPDDLTLITVMQRTDGTSSPREQRVDWFWTAERWDGEPKVMETRKAVQVRWCDLEALPTPIPEYERFVLDGMRTGVLPMDTAVGFSRDCILP